MSRDSHDQELRRVGLDRRRFLANTGLLATGTLVSSRVMGSPPAAFGAEAAQESGFTAHGNPVITDIYTSDPDAFVHNGRLYLDVDRDEAPLGFNDFLMREWRVYSTDDLKHFTDHGPRMSLADFPWADRNAWAPEMVERDGKFFWYVPVRKASDGSMSIAVAVGDNPLGPFRDALEHPLIDTTLANHSAFDIDPTVLIDDDGQAYIYWGSFSSPRAAKLKRNMIELDELEEGGGGGATGPRVPGQIGNAVRLNGVADYVDLPDGILGGLTDFTISTWVNWAGGQTWSRVFDFGTGTTVNMFLTPNAGGAPGLRFAITTSGGGGEQQVTWAQPLPTGWHHVAVTRGGTLATLWVDGAPVTSNPDVTLSPSSMGATTNNWIGRSQYPDPFLSGTIDDFNIYDSALDVSEIQQLAAGTPGAGNIASYRFDEVSGAEALDSSGNGRLATIVSPPVNVVTPQGLVGYWEAPYIFKRNGLYYLAYARGNPLTGGNPAFIDYATATEPLGPWTYRGRILDTVTNTTTNHAAIVQFKNQWLIVYHNGMLFPDPTDRANFPGGGEFRRSVCIDRLRFNGDDTIQPVRQTLGSDARKPIARYTFDRADGTTVVDHTKNGWDATLAGGATLVTGLDGNAVRLDGAGQHVALPTGILWHAYDFTLAAWVRVDSPAAQQRIFDFGFSTGRTMYLTHAGATGVVEFAIRTSLNQQPQFVRGTAALPAGDWVHVAVTKSARLGRLYVNGQQIGENTNYALYPAQVGNSPNNWIGRSQDVADPFLAGLVDDFRIYQRGLTPDEVAELADSLFDPSSNFNSVGPRLLG